MGEGGPGSEGWQWGDWGGGPRRRAPLGDPCRRYKVHVKGGERAAAPVEGRGTGRHLGPAPGGRNGGG